MILTNKIRKEELKNKWKKRNWPFWDCRLDEACFSFWNNTKLHFVRVENKRNGKTVEPRCEIHKTDS